MKRCPVCQSTYADDSLRFCLQDGATLEGARETGSDDYKTLVLPEDAATIRELPPTEVLNPGAQPTARPHQPSPTSPHRPRDTSPITEQARTGEPRTRSTTTVVILSVVGTIALLALGGLSAWLLLRDKSDNTKPNENVANVNTTRAIDNQNNALPNTNTRKLSNTNTLPTPTPALTPTPNRTTEEAEVRAALNGWLSSFKAHDIDAYMAYYANTLDAYYRARNASIERVRVDKIAAFTKYSTIEVWLSDVRIQVDSSGQRAVATFNKAYRLSGPGLNPYTGSGPNRFTWTKIGGRWLITGEEDLPQ